MALKIWTCKTIKLSEPTWPYIRWNMANIQDANNVTYLSNMQIFRCSLIDQRCTHSHRTTPSFNPSMKLSGSLRPVTSWIHILSSSSFWGSYFCASWRWKVKAWFKFCSFSICAQAFSHPHIEKSKLKHYCGKCMKTYHVVLNPNWNVNNEKLIVALQMKTNKDINIINSIYLILNIFKLNKLLLYEMFSFVSVF